MEIQQVFQEFAAPDDIYPYSIDEGFIDLTSSLNYFIPDPQLDRRPSWIFFLLGSKSAFGSKLGSMLLSG